MGLSCCGAVNELRGRADYVFALAGNPNVGKSSMFNTLTGTGVVTANYPGKTVEINVASTRLADLKIGLVDLPGTYALGAVSEDQWVARQALLDGNPDVVIVILDATNLARNLSMLLQLLDMGFPVVAALNLIDEATKAGIQTDVGKLSTLLGVPVIPTVATRGEGLETLLEAAVAAARALGDTDGGCREGAGQRTQRRYGQDTEETLDALLKSMSPLLQGQAPRMSARGLALLLLENDKQFTALYGKAERGAELLRMVGEASERIRAAHGEDAALRLIRERHDLAGSIAGAVQSRADRRELLWQRLWRFTTSPVTGVPVMLLVLAGIFAFLFFVGNFLSGLFATAWQAAVSPLLQLAIHAVAGDGVVARILTWGLDAGIQAALAVGIPYVLTFYFLLAFLEDTGYLNSVAFLTDRIMHRFGLHGRSIIPLVAAAGCNVPAIIGTRVLTTMRERMIASTLIVLIPCSARTAVILGAVASLVGWQWGCCRVHRRGILVAGAGVGLNTVMPGESSGLVMEMFPFRMPSLRTIAMKTWYRFKDFVFVAMPIVLVGSLGLGVLYETGLGLEALRAPRARHGGLARAARRRRADPHLRRAAQGAGPAAAGHPGHRPVRTGCRQPLALHVPRPALRLRPGQHDLHPLRRHHRRARQGARLASRRRDPVLHHRPRAPRRRRGAPGPARGRSCLRHAQAPAIGQPGLRRGTEDVPLPSLRQSVR